MTEPRAGSERGFTRAELEAAYLEHYALVRRLVTRFGVAAQDAADVTHEVFVELGTQRMRPDETESMRGFVAGVARNVVLRHRRSLFRRIRNSVLGGELWASQEARGPEQDLAVRELASMLDRLPDAQRAVFVLMELEDWRAPEVAEALGVPVNTVYSRLRLARAALEEQRDVAMTGERRVP